jgi:hypothetical protein
MKQTNKTRPIALACPAFQPGDPRWPLGRTCFNNMQTHLEGTLDWYRQKALTDPDIAALVGLIDRLQVQFTKALEAMVERQAKLMEIEKILGRKDGK